MYKNVYLWLMKFTWDEAKRRRNLKDHRLDFADAEKVFNGIMRVFEDTRFDYGEQRGLVLGCLPFPLLSSYTLKLKTKYELFQ
jgi:uncharacterized DUF497 family protein